MKRYSETTIAKVNNLLAAGAPESTIAKKTGMSVFTIRYYKAKATRGTKKSRKTTARVVSLTTKPKLWIKKTKAPSTKTFDMNIMTAHLLRATNELVAASKLLG